MLRMMENVKNPQLMQAVIFEANAIEWRIWGQGCGIQKDQNDKV